MISIIIASIIIVIASIIIFIANTIVQIIFLSLALLLNQSWC